MREKFMFIIHVIITLGSLQYGRASRKWAYDRAGASAETKKLPATDSVWSLDWRNRAAPRASGVCVKSQRWTPEQSGFNLSSWVARNFTDTEGWNFWHIPKTAGTSLYNSLKRSIQVCGITECSQYTEVPACRDSNATMVMGHQVTTTNHL
jgi:hypothetical protein